MSLEVTIFNQLYRSLIWSRCQLKIGRTVIEKATIAGVGIERESTDYGQFNGMSGDVRLLAVDEPRGAIEIGTLIEIKQDGKDDWRQFRVGGRYTQGGVTRLTMEAVHE
jgi:hypothetical protein